MTPFDRLIRRAINGWEAYKASKRHRAMLRSNPSYSAAYEQREAARKAHGKTRAAQKAMTDAVHAMLGRAVM